MTLNGYITLIFYAIMSVALASTLKLVVNVGKL